MLRVSAAAVVFALDVGGLGPAAACPVDPERFAAYYERELADRDGFFETHGPIRRLAYIGAAADSEEVRRLAAKGEGPVRTLALWAIARSAPDDPLVAAALDDAAGKAESRNFYQRLVSAALLARAEGVPKATIDRFLPALYNDARALSEEEGEVFKRANLAWALYEIGAPVTREEAERIVARLLGDPFPERSPLTALDAFEVIGPPAQSAVPFLTEVVRGESDVATRLDRPDAARALMAVGGERGEAVVAEYMTEARERLFAEPSAIGQLVGALLHVSDGAVRAERIEDLTELLPYAYCARPDVERLLAAAHQASEVHLAAAEFLVVESGSPPPLVRERLAALARSDDPEIAERAQELLDSM